MMLNVKSFIIKILKEKLKKIDQIFKLTFGLRILS